MDMSIAAMSVNMHLARTQEDFGVAVMKMAMEADTEMLTEALESVESLDPALGNNIDISA